MLTLNEDKLVRMIQMLNDKRDSPQISEFLGISPGTLNLEYKQLGWNLFSLFRDGKSFSEASSIIGYSEDSLRVMLDHYNISSDGNGRAVSFSLGLEECCEDYSDNAIEEYKNKYSKNMKDIFRRIDRVRQLSDVCSSVGEICVRSSYSLTTIRRYALIGGFSLPIKRHYGVHRHYLEVVEDIKGLTDNEKTVDEIAFELGKSRGTIICYAKKNKIRLLGMRRRGDKKRKTDMIGEFAQKGYSSSEIAPLVDLTPKTVRGYAMKSGIRLIRKGRPKKLENKSSWVYNGNVFQ